MHGREAAATGGVEAGGLGFAHCLITVALLEFRRTSVKRFIVLLALTVGLLNVARGENWPQWRGPACNGSTAEANLPDKLSKTETMLWAVDMPGVSSATPVVWGDRIFVSSLDSKTQKLQALCINRVDGKVLWQHEIAEGFSTNKMNQLASPSPITDGNTVYFYYGTGDLLAYDFDGKTLWARNLQTDFGPFNVQWIYGSSPLLHGGKLYVQVLQRDVPPHGPAPKGATPADSYLLAIDPRTGKDLWKHIRPNEAHGESKEAYSSPTPLQTTAGTQIVLIGGDCVSGHDANTGEELWRCGGWNNAHADQLRLVPSVVIADDLAISCPPKGGKIFAVKTDGKGDVTASGVAWKSKDLTSDVCVPLFYKGNLYVLDGDKKKIYGVDPKTGEQKMMGDLGGGSVFRASPTGADGKIYCMNEEGTVWVLSADDLKTLSKNELGGGGKFSRSSVVAAQGTVLVRTQDKLYAFVKK